MRNVVMDQTSEDLCYNISTEHLPQAAWPLQMLLVLQMLQVLQVLRVVLRPMTGVATVPPPQAQPSLFSVQQRTSDPCAAAPAPFAKSTR